MSAAEHAFERRIELEQPPIEERRRIVGDRRDDGEAFLHERFLGRVNIGVSP